MSKALLAIFGVLVIDSMGMGLIMPILPSLIRDVGRLSATGWQFGALLSMDAALQFLVAPLRRALSDRYGRRPVLLVSLAGASVDYVFMAFAPSLAFLFIVRAISGMTGANDAVASAYITDITPEADRAKRFGQVGAIFGIGFILGPILGGVLGAHWVRLPFLAAAVLNAVNFLFVALVVPESRKGSKDAVVPAVSLLGPVKPLIEFGFIWKLITVAVIFGFVGEVAGTIWVLYAEDKFAWDPTMIGISLTAFGVFHIASQAVMVGPLGKYLGERGGLLFSMAADGLAYVLMALAGQGWMAFALMPLFALGGSGGPILQGLLSGQVDGDRQGTLMGLMTGLQSIVSIFAPLSISLIYFATRDVFPGTVWIGAAAMYLVALPFLFGAFKKAPVPVG